MSRQKNRVCPVSLAGGLDNKIRRWLQNPRKILAPYIQEGMTVLDIGCGPGFFSIEMAQLVGKSGKVFAADLQEGMLQ
jgi:ubiquinone/menaquinone biosynthesis C-methylase UbiE